MSEQNDYLQVSKVPIVEVGVDVNDAQVLLHDETTSEQDEYPQVSISPTDGMVVDGVQPLPQEEAHIVKV